MTTYTNTQCAEEGGACSIPVRVSHYKHKSSIPSAFQIDVERLHTNQIKTFEIAPSHKVTTEVASATPK